MVVGNGDVTLQAAVGDNSAASNGASVLGVTFAAYANGHPNDAFASNPGMELDTPSGTTAQLILSQADLQKAASEYGTGSEVSITWTARAVVEGSNGPESKPSPRASCTFIFNDATPSTPSLWADSAHTTACDSLSGLTIGDPATVYVTSPDGTTATAPSSYSYSLNSGGPQTVAADTAAPYAAAFSVTPTSGFNVLSVTAVGPGGNLSQTATCDFPAAEPGPEADQDLTGDSIPDLLTAGTGTSGGVAPGLWLAAGEGSNGTFNGTVNTAATDIAPSGPQGVGTPASWDGFQAIIGQFLGSGDNAVQAYNPATGVGFLFPGLGNGTVNVLQGLSLADTFDFQPYIDANGDTNANPDAPLQLVDAYNVSGNNTGYPDEMGVVTDPTLGGFLAYYAANDGAGIFDASTGAPYILSNLTPDGTMDWSNWTITTAAAPAGAETASGSPVLADMYLWNSQTGALYLWELTGLGNEVTGVEGFPGFIPGTNSTATLSYAQVTVDPGTSTDTGWNTGSTLNTLQAIQINGGTGLIDVTSTGQVQSWAVDINDGTATAAIAQANATGSSQLLQTGN
ncbi:MAG TPA: hypothetical protein VK817_22995 [Trebonia sp.]|nr:hypothetical protein [Trebonia sp.]